MRTFAVVSSLVLGVIACNPLSGGADSPGGTSSAKSPTSPTSEDDQPSAEASSEPSAASGTTMCSRYLSCIAKTNPGALGELSDTYGKSGSCFEEMSASDCQAACKVGLRQASCPLEKCTTSADCMTDEICAVGECLPDKHRASCKVRDDCGGDGHFECGSLDGESEPVCLLRCRTTSECPSPYECLSDGFCLTAEELEAVEQRRP